MKNGRQDRIAETLTLLIYLLPGRKEIMSFVIRLCLKLLPNCHGGIM